MRERELLDLRKQYYEERKKANRLYKNQYVGSSKATHASEEKATASSYANAHGHELDPTWELEAEFLPIESLHTFGHGADTDDLRVYSSDDDASVDAKDVHSRYDDELWDVEDVETRGPLVNMETFRCQSTLERVSAIRELCIQNLGQSQFENLYQILRDRSSHADDHEGEESSRGKVMQLLGPNHQFIRLLDRLVYEEDVCKHVDLRTAYDCL